MAVNDDGEVAGSVSGGCVEGAVVDRGARGPRPARGSAASSRSATPTTRRSPSASPAAARSTSSSSRSTGESPSRRSTSALRDALRAEQPVALATVIAGPARRAPSCSSAAVGAALGTLGDPDLDRVVARDALGELEAGLTSTRHYGAHGEAREDTVSVFIESFAPPPRMVIFGAVDFTAALAAVAKVLGYRVTVCDARAVFATRQRFPMADEVVVDWPNRSSRRSATTLGPRDAVCVLTHDRKFDVPAIVGALATRVGYLGAMGSRTHARQADRAAARGRRHRRASSPGIRRRSASTSAPARRRRRRSRSAPRSSPPAPAGRRRPCATRPGRSTREPRHRGPPAPRSRRRRAGSASRPRARWPTKGSRSRSAAGRASGSTPRRREIGPRAVPLVADVSTEEGAAGFVHAARDALGGVDILVCNGGGPPPGNFASTPPEAYRAAIELNCLTAHRDVPGGGPGDARAAVGAGGRDHVDRGAPTHRQPDPLEHRPAGLTGFLKTLAREVAGDGVTVNSLLPGLPRHRAGPRASTASSMRRGRDPRRA